MAQPGTVCRMLPCRCRARHAPRHCCGTTTAALLLWPAEGRRGARRALPCCTQHACLPSHDTLAVRSLWLPGELRRRKAAAERPGSDAATPEVYNRDYNTQLRPAAWLRRAVTQAAPRPRRTLASTAAASASMRRTSAASPSLTLPYHIPMRRTLASTAAASASMRRTSAASARASSGSRCDPSAASSRADTAPRSSGGHSSHSAADIRSSSAGGPSAVTYKGARFGVGAAHELAWHTRPG